MGFSFLPGVANPRIACGTATEAREKGPAERRLAACSVFVSQWGNPRTSGFSGEKKLPCVDCRKAKQGEGLGSVVRRAVAAAGRVASRPSLTLYMSISGKDLTAKK
jgi:hypothetical protein